ncbi:hypothetical protein GCM10010911_66400 [Paenibacillus nasutitermitis]|uniref:Uncharacterized protein n=1 Tax=Paenibacillus nasutitermitis TaxID=1652958 RepID=A0A916ZH98_9BACL|nr:hypothetical protein GCM10010911_66400 [Paenibacillus nasutitermitis]
MRTKTAVIVTMILLLFNVILIFLVDLLTFKMIPGRAISGNGNPAFILWFIEIPAYVFLLLGICYIVNKEKYFTNRSIYYPLLFLLIIVASVYLQYNHANHINSTNANLIDEYGWINQYTNTIYINYYTFLMGIFTLLGLQSLFQRIKKV